MDDYQRAELLKVRMKYMWDNGRGESPESLARIFGFSVDLVRKTLGIQPPPAPPIALPEPRLTVRQRSHLQRRR